ncbi:hypothetical protein JW978_00180 [Candidatus Dojkabacteria bacterium]|nr:hypothetical protein [Candidatus Dojkabacteria bacterium]
MLKKVSIAIVVITLLVIIGVWSPWRNLDFSLMEFFGLKQSIDYAGLQVYSLSGEIEVEIDGELAGNVTVDGSPLDIVEIDPGEHLVTVKRVPEDQANDPIYYQLNRVIKFEKGINTVIAYELGPTKDFSEGYLITTSRAINPGSPKLNITTSPDVSNVIINNLDAGSSPVSNYEINLFEDYNIKILKENFETIEFSLLPDDDVQRELLSGYDINVEVSLFQIPIEIIEVNE